MKPPFPFSTRANHLVSKTITLQALADLVGGKIAAGDAGATFTGLNSLSEAAAGEVSFLGNPRYAPQLATTKASVVLISPDHSERPEGKCYVEVANPTLAFSAVIAWFGVEKIETKPGIHPSAVVSPTAKLNPSTVHVGPLVVVEAGAVVGDGCVLHAGAYVGHGAKVGANSVLHAHAVLKDHCVLGQRVIIHSGAVIGSDGFGYEFVQGRHLKIDQVGIVEVGDDVEIGSCTCIDRARFGKTRIGRGTKIDNLVQIAHNVTTGEHCILVSQVGISGSTKLGNYVIMGGQSGASGHLEITDQVTVLGRAGVTKDIREKGHYTGFPARPLMEGRKLMAYPGKVPELQKRIRELERRLAELESRL